jgi:ankyrin repeat protein
LATRNSHEAVVKLLLENGADLEPKDSDGHTPLSWVVKKGHEAVVKLLLAKDGIEPDSRDTEYGRTPLSLDARNGHEAVVKLLLDNKADVDAKDNYGLTALH